MCVCVCVCVLGSGIRHVLLMDNTHGSLLGALVCLKLEAEDKNSNGNVFMGRAANGSDVHANDEKVDVSEFEMCSVCESL